MSWRSSVTALILLSPYANAYTTFHTNCSFPSVSTSYITAPNTRGTLGIIWSCLFTIIACTWTIQHLNVPVQRERRQPKAGPSRYWRSALWTLSKFWTKLKWMLFNIIAPEVILGKAIGESIEARYIQKQLNELRNVKDGDAQEWTPTHSFFLFMGGFRVTVHDDAKDEGTASQSIRQEQDSDDEGAENAESHALQNVANAASDDTKIEYIMTSEYILWLVRNKHLTDIETFPGVTKEEILDKSKSDTFVKALAVIQVFWVCLEVIVRGIKGLAITQLELATTAFCACAILTYIFVIPKPQSVELPLPPYRLSRTAHAALVRQEWNQDDLCLRDFTVPGKEPFRIDLTSKRIPNDYISIIHQNSVIGYYVGMIAGCVLFNGIHLAAWNFRFPTHAEQLLWHISGILATCLFPISMIVTVFVSAWEWLPGVELRYVNLFCGLVYILARLFLLVETFRSLAFLPPDAFRATWVSNLPSVV